MLGSAAVVGKVVALAQVPKESVGKIVTAEEEPKARDAG